MIKRVVFDLILLISVFIFPWWASVIIILIGMFIFDRFYEFIIASSIIFSLYSILDGRIISSPVFFSLMIIALYTLIQYFKDNIILYKK
jgi:hypothetical protein